MRNFFFRTDPVFHLLVILVIGGLAFGFYQLNQKFKDIPQLINSLTSKTPSEKVEVQEKCGKDCEEEIEKRVSEALSKVSTKTSTKVADSSSKGTTYIPLNGTFSTVSTSWTDVIESDVYIKAEDYGKSPYISFEASLKTSHANGKVYARLYDVTNNIAVDGSELISTSQTFSSVSSGNLPFWRGNNLYRVQVKSLDGQEVSFSSGRVKIVSK